jgi:peptidoglycan-associated lipoprotein
MMKKLMTVLITVAFISTTLLVMTSCAKKNVKAEGTTTGGTPPATSAQGPAAGGPGKESAPATPAEADVIKIITTGSIYFDFDKAELSAASKDILKKKADVLRDNPKLSVTIEGHCDERGTNEYNLALGERRADAAFKYLNAMGIAADRLKTVSYGEEKPAAAGHDEAAWSKNRRDEFKVNK